MAVEAAGTVAVEAVVPAAMGAAVVVLAAAAVDELQHQRQRLLVAWASNQQSAISNK